MTTTNTHAEGARGSAVGHRGSTTGRSRWVLVPAAFGVITLAAGCGGSYSSTSATSATSAASSTPAGTSPAAAAVLSTASTGIGTVVVDSKRATVYEFANDHGGTSACTGTCATNWPPVVAPSSVPSSLPGVSGEVGAITRTDGSRQLTVAGHPVYTFVGDTAPGQTNGQGKVLNGGLWTAVSSSGAPVGTATPAPGTTSSGTY